MSRKMSVTGGLPKPVRGSIFLRRFMPTRRDESRKRCLGCTNRIGMGLDYKDVSLNIFVRAQHHFECDRFTIVRHGLPSFEFGKDVVDSLGFDVAVVI